ncbi:hypothetical protein RHMOL_Rhmol13G0279900 [Rhododendron molle]|uniref:Uncharacterized protein n=1 Tax=Rhododendron molle TaxID=49168 RepID=A0ACC0LBX5_RHOML|nr:hypothetical protein RHMOL_Rhmol13G0279900 [Rhododendron molle]
MATSSNQPGENIDVSTSKPGRVNLTSFSSSIVNSEGQKYGLSWFDDFQMVDDESVVDQAYKISRMVADHAKSCPRLHMVLNDKEELVNVIIEKLPVSWEDYAARLKDMQMEKELSFGALVNHLRVEEKKRAQYQKVEFVEEKKEYSRYLPLYKAALRGDWATAERFFDQDPGALTAPINEFSRTALYVAAVHGRNTNDFVKKLVDKMPPGSVDAAYGSVLNWAAYVGNTEAVKVILSKNPSLVYFREDDTSPNKRTPFTRAATNGMRDTLLYLLELVKNDEDSSKLFPDEDSAAFFMAETISSGFYGNTNTLLEFTSLIVLFLHN